ncbi:uncharacterized protein K444DRAFT_628993 [Hyaloscypha bicolor E]|uniref:Uncharacterized protein n=1 Tax=Hyaloscypha bicolor E TaxID=1095630 RepID=A0A2J6TD74_9HELO|nr:uncharacterized protein K444DRAFT_628993 [Hyaloscypha bicolor E]PMD60971.1 hypothetical protein K444DRAFT_628993 [Hyaloscypha bicolor E]
MDIKCLKKKKFLAEFPDYPYLRFIITYKQYYGFSVRSFTTIPYLALTTDGATAPVKLRIGEALEFNDQRTLVAFFEDGPGGDAITLYNVRLLGVSNLDDHTATGWKGRTANV